MEKMIFTVEMERETDGRWLADVRELPGVMAYGETQEDAFSAVEALALRVVAEKIEHKELASVGTVEFKHAA
jgi:predicted RNase H-like HicB family nuclease